MANVILIGPLPIPEDVVGGTKVSFANLLSDLQRCNSYTIEVINSSRPVQGKSRIVRRWLNARCMALLLWRLWWTVGRSQVVMWNVSPGGAIRAALFVRAVCALRRRPLIVRVFGGDFDEFYDCLSRFRRWITDRCLLNANLVLFQTLDLVARFEDRRWVQWLPTTRDMPARSNQLSANCKRFLFVGQLRREKGIDEILQACRHLPAEVEVTIAGPSMEGFDVAKFETLPRIRYLGALPPSGIIDVIEAHDVLLFPSYYQGEGYPGVIVEALQLGLPVIATKWKALPELVGDEENGLLVPPADARALAMAMQRLIDEPSFFRALQVGAMKRGDAFRGGHALRKLKSWIDELAR